MTAPSDDLKFDPPAEDLVLPDDAAPTADLVEIHVPLDDDSLPESLSTVMAHMHIDRLDLATRHLRRHLDAVIIDYAKAKRAERELLIGPATETPRGETDVAELVRQLAHAADILRRIGGDFVEAAKTAEDEIVYEAVEECDKVRIVIPDADTEIVAAFGDTNVTAYDLDAVAEVIAHDLVLRETETQGSGPEGSPDRLNDMDPDAIETCVDRANPFGDYLTGYRAGVVAGITVVAEQYLSSPKWKTTALDALRRLLMGRGDDAMAGILERGKHVTVKTAEKMTVKREAFKARRRAS